MTLLPEVDKEADSGARCEQASVVSSGKIDVLVRKGQEIPDGWVYPSVKPFLDSDGVVPMSVLQYPLGGKK